MEGVGDAVDVVKVADNLGGIMDRSVIKTVGLQSCNVGLSHFVWGAG